MLILDDEERWTAITQPAHAWLTGEIARAWGAGDIAPAEPRAEVALGASQHDVAWTAADLRPPLHEPAGRAASFIEAPFAHRHPIWNEAPDRVLALHPWAALLVSLHGTNIHTRYTNPEYLPADEAAQVAAYLERERERQDRLLALLGVARADAERAGELVFCLDALSLSLCHRWPERELPPVEGGVVRWLPAGPDEGTLDPWPLAADELSLVIPQRTLTERFTDEAAMQAALADAPYERRVVTLRRA